MLTNRAKEQPRRVIAFSNATYTLSHTPALEEVSLNINEGEFVGIIGPNGSGKTTILRAILGLVLPQTGTMQIFDCACENLRCYHRARIGYLPQKGKIDRNFPITVFETVLMGRYGVRGLFHQSGKEDRTIALQALEDVGMRDFKNYPFGQLSGGQQQRIFIARALAQQPQVLLLDEPTTGIDTTTQHTILELIRRLHRELQLTILLVTHDINLISPFVDRLVLLNTRLFANGHPCDVLQHNILSQVYGDEIIVTDNGYVIGGDSHHE
ncbi:MAG: zinc ABC transporter ATP-binding protein [Nitrospiraceae bacterium]|jgi:ABC-type Mn2+/Zn2+ transport system ATPase subunit|nr:zinc ABC transporter ATP-binding protein [Nitrospiraceae bacterium]